VGSADLAASLNTNKRADIGQKDIFLKLLVAQMQNQDPLKPQDATQMSSQLAQFNMVEQQTTSNKLLEQLVASGGGSSNAPSGNAASYLGRSVTINQDQLNFDGTTQNFTAVLDKPATEALVFIFDANGNPVRTMPLANLPAGKNALAWDGLTDSGATAAPGNYTVQISATDVSGSTVPYGIQRSGIVDAVRFNATGTELMVGGIPVSMADVKELRL
jgi:flagellar basal-body rod modification protein FlgD